MKKLLILTTLIAANISFAQKIEIEKFSNDKITKTEFIAISKVIKNEATPTQLDLARGIIRDVRFIEIDNNQLDLHRFRENIIINQNVRMVTGEGGSGGGPS